MQRQLGYTTPRSPPEVNAKTFHASVTSCIGLSPGEITFCVLARRRSMGLVAPRGGMAGGPSRACNTRLVEELGGKRASYEPVHHVPGRLRLQTNRLKGSRRGFSDIRAAAASIEGVVEASANAATGSLIIRYDRKCLNPQDVWQSLCDRHIVWGPSPISDRERVTRTTLQPPSASSPAGRLIETVTGILVQKLTERSALAVVGAFIYPSSAYLPFWQGSVYWPSSGRARIR
jgi:hypothetical protein